MALAQVTREIDPPARPRPMTSAARGGLRLPAAFHAARHRTAVLLGLAAAALLLGVLVYLTDRSADHVALLPRLDGLAGWHLFGAIGQSLPSFLHPFAFSLATAAAWRPGVARRWIACATWCVLNLGFEFAQHPVFKAAWSRDLHDLAGAGGIERWVLNYCLQGTFDVGDVAAVLLGALCAGAVLWFVDRPATTAAAARPASRPFRSLRCFATAGVTLSGLVGIVGSGGGLGSDCPPGDDCSAPPPQLAASIAPEYVTAQVGTSVTYSATTAHFATTPSYQWSRSDDGGLHYTPIAGATASTYSIPSVNLSDDGATFRVSATSGGTGAAAMSHLAVSAQPGLVFQDGEFLDADWLVMPFSDANEPAPVQTSERVTTGGTPGAYRKMVFTLGPQALSGRVSYLSRTAIYDPRQQGAIYVIDFAEDGIELSGNADNSTESALMFTQAGRTYLGNARSDGVAILTSNWSNVANRASLLAGDFTLIAGPACAGGESCPDFSALGLPMQFGYWRISLGVQGDVIAHGIDNWKVTVWSR